MAHRFFDDSSIEADYFPLFEELHLVLIGCHYAGKNTVGNAILRKHVFKYKTTYEKHNARRQRAVFGRRITIVRVPGWYGDLSLEEGQPEINQEVRDCLKEFKNGPHAIILCVAEKSTVTDRTMNTLQNLLSDNVWNHTIIVFTTRKKLKSENIDDYIKDKDLQVLWETCRKRHHILTKWPSFDKSRKLIEDIEEMIARKSAPFTFSIPEMRSPEEIQAEKNKLLKRIQDKINLQEKDKSRDVKRRVRVNAERVRLQDLKKHVEDQIRRSIQSQLSICSQTGGENQPHETRMLDESMTFRRTTLMSSPSRQDLRGWGNTLVSVLDELKDQQFESMKYIMGCRNEWKLLKSKLGSSRADVAEIMIQTWGESLCIINIRDIMKEIPRNDQAITSLIMPFLEAIGEKW
ncbi:hypothetical protein AOLI_G00106820 [Acnodon oligacanthus]